MLPVDPRNAGPSTARSVVLVLLFIALLAGAVLVFPQYLVDRSLRLTTAPPPSTADRLKAENDIRTTLVQALGALVLLAGAVMTWRQLQATLERNRDEMDLSRQGQVTERFTRAIEQLGSDTLAVRLGAIYALERIARDSPRDHGPILELLTAFVRERAPRRPGGPAPVEREDEQKPAADIQAVLTVLGRRDIRNRGQEPWQLDLSHTDLRWAEIADADLKGVSFVDAVLAHAKFSRTHLEEAVFHDADLRWTLFLGCHLDRARLELAKTEGWYLDEHTTRKDAVLD